MAQGGTKASSSDGKINSLSTKDVMKKMSKQECNFDHVDYQMRNSREVARSGRYS